MFSQYISFFAAFSSSAAFSPSMFKVQMLVALCSHICFFSMSNKLELFRVKGQSGGPLRKPLGKSCDCSYVFTVYKIRLHTRLTLSKHLKTIMSHDSFLQHLSYVSGLVNLLEYLTYLIVSRIKLRSLQNL